MQQSCLIIKYASSWQAVRAPAVRVMSLVFEDNHTNIYSKQKATKLNRNLHNVSIVIFKTSNKIKWQSLVRNTSCLKEIQQKMHYYQFYTLKVSIQTFHSTIIYSNQMIQMPNETENKHVKEYILTHMTFN